MKSSQHSVYIIGSLLAAVIASTGMYVGVPFMYGILPGIIGLGLLVVATTRFFRHRKDLAGFIATLCGFVFYQAFQANPVMLPEFASYIAPVDNVDKMLGIFLANFTVGMLLISVRLVNGLFGRQLRLWVPGPKAAARDRVDGWLMGGFVLIFALVALPNVLFGRVVVGAINTILYQRASWDANSEFSGYATGGAVTRSLLNTTFWSTSMFFLWVYLLGSKYRRAMLVLSPLVLLWSVSVAFQGTRTYLVIMGFGLILYYFGNPRFRGKIFLIGGIASAILLVLVQTAALFRTTGLVGADPKELLAHLAEIRGNEGTSSQIDGLEYFRTQLLRNGAAVNPVSGLVRGLIERPIEGILMPLPRSLFPWKPVDDSATEFSIYFQNVRLGVPSAEAFLGASPGLMGRELIRYGLFGPVTVLFWLGLVLALADRLYARSAATDFNRIFATTLVTFFVAEMRDWVPLWFLPLIPAILILGYVARRARRSYRPERNRTAQLAAAATAANKE